MTFLWDFQWHFYWVFSFSSENVGGSRLTILWRTSSSRLIFHWYPIWVNDKYLHFAKILQIFVYFYKSVLNFSKGVHKTMSNAWPRWLLWLLITRPHCVRKFASFFIYYINQSINQCVFQDFTRILLTGYMVNHSKQSKDRHRQACFHDWPSNALVQGMWWQSWK